MPQPWCQLPGTHKHLRPRTKGSHIQGRPTAVLGTHLALEDPEVIFQLHLGRARGDLQKSNNGRVVVITGVNVY